MNNEIKILLTLYREGGVLKYKDVEEREYHYKVPVVKKNKKGKDTSYVSGSYTVRPAYQPLVTQQIRMSVDAYNYMASTACPDWFRDIKKWRKMSITERLEAHFTRTMQHFNAKKFTYSIIDD